MKNLAETIKNGGLVAVPTETVYGIACNGLDSDAVKSVYEIKGRPEIKPLSLMVHDSSWIDRFCQNVPRQAYYLAERYWPGPLSIVLESREIVPEIVRAGGKTVSLRCPDSDLTLDLLSKANLPFAAPSANPSGYPSPKSADEVYAYFGDSVEILDGGVCRLGIESTIIDMSLTPYKVLREGALPKNVLISALIDGLNIIGLTGQSGSGKSKALEFLSDNGFSVIDCDSVYHKLINDSEEMLSDIEFLFPEAFEDGVLQRKLLARIVFNSKEDLESLNSITHFYVVSEVKNILESLALNGKDKVVIEAVELISSGLGELCNRTIAVTADEKVRTERIMKRDCLNYEEALSRIRAQKDESYYAENCDAVIDNSGDISDFEAKLLKEVQIDG